MVKIEIRQRNANGRWQTLGLATVAPGNLVTLPPVSATESDPMSLRIDPGSSPGINVRVMVGTVLVASTIPTDLALPIETDDESESATPPYVCKGPLLADWAGITELTVRLRPEASGEWFTVLHLPLAVSAGKVHSEEFERLFAALEHESTAVLVDIYGKTQIGLKEASPISSAAPVAVLYRLRETVGQLGQVLQLIARHPACRLRPIPTREQAMAGQSVSAATLDAACADPSILVRAGGRVAFREQVQDWSRPDYRIGEHQVIADFLVLLRDELADLRERILTEIGERTERKRWRNTPKGPGKPTWWQSEDLPRIEELGRCKQELDQLVGVIQRWAGMYFLPPGERLRRKPTSTPLFRNDQKYRRAFRIIAGHFFTYRASIDTHSLMIRARSLPVLYEWWCAIRVLRILTDGLSPQPQDPLRRPVVKTHLVAESKRFTIEFANDQAVTFTDGQGARVRFRYQPEYTAVAHPVALLGEGSRKTPDMAVEVFPVSAPPANIPELIIVLDAKYSSDSQERKRDEVKTKYSSIGDRRTGRILSRQVWALTPRAPGVKHAASQFSGSCTVDNGAFWSDEFDLKYPVHGAIQTRPASSTDFDPLRSLLSRLLQLAGVAFIDRSGTAQTDERV